MLEKSISEPSVKVNKVLKIIFWLDLLKILFFKFVLIEKLLVAFLLGVIYVILSKDYPVISNLCKKKVNN